MSGAIKREQGETFAAFSTRQKAIQADEAKVAVLVKTYRKRYPRTAKIAREAFGDPLDHDYSMNS